MNIGACLARTCVDNAVVSSHRIMSETQEPQAKMQELEAEQNALLTRMDFLVEHFRSIAPGAAAVWVRSEFERGIKDNAEQIQELGVPGVRAIKADMERLINDLPSICFNLLENRSTWAHHQNEPVTRSEAHKDFFFDRIFRDLISKAGPVLENHNLLHNRGPHPYCGRTKEGWRYAMNPSIGPVMTELYEEYMKGLQRLRELRRRHANEKKTLAEARAQNLWETA